MRPPQRARQRRPNAVNLANAATTSNPQSRAGPQKDVVAFALSLLVISCAAPNLVQSDPEALAALDEAAFRCNVQPILQRDCSYLGCHGREGMPLRLYGIGALRLDTKNTTASRAQALSDAELHANFLSAQGQSFHTPPERNQLVLKSLPSAAGGYAHVGGAIWSGMDDPRVQTLLQWLGGQGADCPPQGGAP